MMLSLHRLMALSALLFYVVQAGAEEHQSNHLGRQLDQDEQAEDANQQANEDGAEENANDQEGAEEDQNEEDVEDADDAEDEEQDANYQDDYNQGDDQGDDQADYYQDDYNQDAEEEEYEQTASDYDYTEEFTNPELSLTETLLGSGENITNYHLRLSSCNRVNKGSYQASHQNFLQFHTCLNTNAGYLTQIWDTFTCPHISHVVRMDEYFLATSSCVQDYCDECTDACNEAGYCNSGCIKQCESYYNVTEGDAYYTGCNGPFPTPDGKMFYLGPSCSSNGGVTMSYFNDANCEVSVNENVLPFNVFDFVDSVCSDCSVEGVCESLWDASIHCYDDTLTAVAVGGSMNLQPSEYADDDDTDDGMISTGFVNEVCYETSTDKQKRHPTNSHTWLGRVRTHLLNSAMAIVVVGLVWLAFMAIASLFRDSPALEDEGSGTENLCNAGYLDEDEEDDESFEASLRNTSTTSLDAALQDTSTFGEESATATLTSENESLYTAPYTASKAEAKAPVDAKRSRSTNTYKGINRSRSTKSTNTYKGEYA